MRFYTGCSISLLNNERNDKKIMLKVKNVEIGSGIPKVCAPIVEKNQDDILEMGEILMAKKSVDIVEWRIDFFEDRESRYSPHSAQKMRVGKRI